MKGLQTQNRSRTRKYHGVVWGELLSWFDRRGGDLYDGDLPDYDLRSFYFVMRLPKLKDAEAGFSVR